MAFDAGEYQLAMTVKTAALALSIAMRAAERAGLEIDLPEALGSGRPFVLDDVIVRKTITYRATDNKLPDVERFSARRETTL